MSTGLEQLKSIKSFPSLVRYLRDELDWPIDSDDVEDLTFDYEPDELGLDKQTAVKVKEIKQLRPLATNQPWGIFFINFEPKRLPIVALRRILRALVIKKRTSTNKSQLATWQLHDLLFISSYGEVDGREITLAHFSENSEMGDLPTLKVLGWNTGNTVLRLEDTHSILKEKLRWPEDEADAEAWRESWSSAFKLQYRETVRTSKDLAVRLARLAENIRGRVNEVLAVESERGELRKLYKAFQEALIHDLSEDDFADMYAQTIAYGLLSASISRQSGALVADNLPDMVPNTNPFLKELMQTFLTVGGRKGRIDFDELGINEVVELLRHTQMDEVLKDFGAKNPQEDPVIHFYELFLKEYDPEKRMRRGVFYTPRPVVSFIVRSVDEILRTEFGLEDGLADTTTWGEMRKRHEGLTIPQGVNPDEPFVQILDPATGTGTFLVEVIDRIFGTMRAKWKREGKSEQEMYDLWNDYVPRHLLPRLHGFELMMAPYAIAHMKIGLKLTETKYRFLSSERARIYLTNTLEEPKDFSSYFEQMAPALAHEANQANKIKRGAPITVIIGNPPYSIISSNQGSWITDLCEKYKEHVRSQERQIQALSDDYVKFVRYGEWRIEQVDAGVFGMITNNGYLDGHLFNDMRRSLLHTFEKAFIVNLHGNLRTGERTPEGDIDQNVFDIQTGVAISLFAKKGGVQTNPGLIRYHDIWGDRVGKYATLINPSNHIGKLKEITVDSPRFILLPISDELNKEWFAAKGLLEIFGIGNPKKDAQKAYAAGFVTQQDKFAIAFTPDEIIDRVKELLSPSMTESDLRGKYRLCTTNQWSFDRARGELKQGDFKQLITTCTYRPFDTRWTVFHRGVVTILRTEVMRHLFHHNNIALLATRGISRQQFAHVFVSDSLTDRHAIDNASESMFVFPLLRFSDTGRSLIAQQSNASSASDINLSKSLRSHISNNLNIAGTDKLMGDLMTSIGPFDIFHYLYAITHSLAYRERYAEFLKIDFPRIPLTSDAELFRKLCLLGADLVALHLLEDDYEAASWNTSRPKGKSPLKTPITRFAGKGGAEVTKGHPKYKDGNVYINPSRYFEGVPEEVWKFHVGGYQVCEKWLKDRRERTLTDEDIAHYQRVVVALRETICLMAEIDRTIEAHGGWPLVGNQETAQQSAPGGLPFA